MLTSTERKLAVRILELARDLENAYPDIGIGPAVETTLRKELKRLDLPVTTTDVKRILLAYNWELTNG